MKFHLDGYVLRNGPRGAEYVKTVEFMHKRLKDRATVECAVVLVRSPRGKLLRVERRRKP